MAKNKQNITKKPKMGRPCQKLLGSKRHDNALGQNGSGTCRDMQSDSRCVLKAKPTEGGKKKNLNNNNKKT